MTERMIPVPESALRALREWWNEDQPYTPDAVLDALVACLPEPEPTFTDEEALAYDAARWGVKGERAERIEYGRRTLTTLAKAGWTAPKALCPPPSPALVELVEAVRDIAVSLPMPHVPLHARLRAAVAAYDEQEGTP